MALCRDLGKEYASISPERFTTEFEKLYSKGQPSYGFRALRSTGWANFFGLGSMSKEDDEAVDRVVERAKKNHEDPAIFGAAKTLTFVPPSKRKEVAGKLLKGEKRIKKAFSLLRQNPGDANPKPGWETIGWARRLTRQNLTAKEYIVFTGRKELEAQTKAVESFEGAQPDFLTGSLVLEHTTKTPGPWLGQLLREGTDAQDRGVFKTSEEALNWLKTKLS